MSKQRQYERQFGRYKLTKRDGSESWYAQWYDESEQKTQRLSLRCSDLDEAERRLAEQFILHEPMRRDDPGNVPLTVVLERYFDRHAKHKRSAGEARRAIDRLIAFFGDLSVADLTPEEQRRYVRQMQSRGLARGTIKREIVGVLRPALTHAYDNGELDRIPPVLKGAEFGPDAVRERLLLPGEIAALWDAANTDRMRMFLVLSINTLSRPEAIFDLTRTQADLTRGLLDLNPSGRQQTKKHRPTVPITRTLHPWLAACESEYFVNYRGRRVTNLAKHFRQTRDAAGLDADVVPYTIRHTMATELRSRGVPAWEVSGFLGHRTHGTTERYAKFAPDHLSAAVTALDAYCRELQVSTPMVLDAVPFRAKGA